MQLVETLLPWGKQPVRSTENIFEWVAARLPREFVDYLPKSISVLIDPDVTRSELDAFLNTMVEWLSSEFVRRNERRSQFVKLRFFSHAELDFILTSNTNLQPWILYYSKDGGLGTLDPAATPRTHARGLTPCSSMINHGVAWSRTAQDAFDVWLVTARPHGQAWNWDADIGHESAHAAFAPVPLFAQFFESSASLRELAELGGQAALSPNQLAELRYPFSELAVVAMRGEPRDTATGLPVDESEDLFRLLRVAGELMPGIGFDRARDAFERASGFVDVNQGIEIFEIGAPALRIAPAIAKIAHRPDAPSIQWFRQLAQSLAA